jgi:putative hemolysin
MSIDDDFSRRRSLFCVLCFVFGLSLIPGVGFALPNPAATMCDALGYTIREEKCIFPDGTSCDQWAFWRGTCGQTYHICTLRGGSLEMDQKTPVCRIDDKLYVWRVERVSQSKQGEWTVVLHPHKSPRTS